MTKTEFNACWYELYTNIFSKIPGITQTLSNSAAGIVKKYLYKPGKIRVIVSNAKIDENVGTVRIQVERYENSDGQVSVSYKTVEGSAKAGTDYVNTAGTLNWADGEMGQKELSIPIIDDQIFENNEIKTFALTILNPVGGATLGLASISIEIRDNEVNIPPSNPDLPPHNNSPFIQTPHDKIPNFGQNPTKKSVKSGNWSDPLTWGGTLPVNEDVVSITGTTEVLYDVNSNTLLDTVVVQDAGILKFKTDVVTQLVTKNILVLEGGSLEIGDHDNPVTANSTIVFRDTPLDLTKDPFQFGNGLVCFGKLTVCGCGDNLPKTFIKVAEQPLKGQTTIKLSEPAIGWNIGNEIFVPDTHQLEWWEKINWNFTQQNEKVLITGISSDKLTITINKPLLYDHLGHLENNLPTTLPHIGLLTRNVLFVSENPNGVRGHILTTMGAEANVCHAHFKDLGRTTNEPLDSTVANPDGSIAKVGTNQIGRYAFHLHHTHGMVHNNIGHNESDFQFEVEGISIENPKKWGISIHGSHYGKLSNSVVYNAFGAGIVTEDGSESFNIIEENFVCKVWGTGSADDGGRDGIGFWFRGPNNYVRKNVAANCYPGWFCYGYSINCKYISPVQIPIAKGSAETKTVNMNATPILEFADNEVYASCNGITYYWLGTLEGLPIEGAVAGEMKNLNIWHCFNGCCFGYASQGLTMNGWTCKGDTTHIDAEHRIDAAIYFSDYFQKDLVIKNCNIRGFKLGINTPLSSIGTTLIDSCTFKVLAGIASQNYWAVSGGAGALPRHLQINNCIFLPDETTIYIKKNYYIGSQLNGIVKNSIQVLNLNNTGENFNIFVPEQLPNAIVPANGANQTGGWPFVGAPEEGLTNEQCYDKYGICVNAEIAPIDCETVPYIVGIIKRF